MMNFNPAPLGRTLNVPPVPIKFKISEGFPTIIEALKRDKHESFKFNSGEQFSKTLCNRLDNPRTYDMGKIVLYDDDAADLPEYTGHGASHTPPIPGPSSSEEGEDVFDEDDDEEYAPDEEGDDSRVGGISETAEETDNPIAAAQDRYYEKGYKKEDIPGTPHALKAFMKVMRDEKIVQIKYSSKASADSNRERLALKLGLSDKAMYF